MALDFHLPTPRDTALQRKLGDVLARHLASADLLGRLQIVRHAHKKTGRLLPIAETAHAIRFDEDQAQDATVGFSFDLPDDRSASLIGQLTPVTRAVFDGLTSQYRKDAFTLAGVADVRLIQKIRDALGETARTGQTAADWRAAVDRLTSEAGVENLNASTLDTAFQTSMQKAYSAGRLEQMQQPHMVEALPFWQYWTVGDDRVRPEHEVLDGFLARAIDPVWRKIYPPSGFNCRCSVVPIPAEEALKIDPKCGEGGLERLPMLARIFVPQPGFHVLLAA
jgi:SPP1 gp7 family putative phage head morphogenesis protein